MAVVELAMLFPIPAVKLPLFFFLAPVEFAVLLAVIEPVIVAVPEHIPVAAHKNAAIIESTAAELAAALLL